MLDDAETPQEFMARAIAPLVGIANEEAARLAKIHVDHPETYKELRLGASAFTIIELSKALRFASEAYMDLYDEVQKMPVQTKRPWWVRLLKVDGR